MNLCFDWSQSFVNAKIDVTAPANAFDFSWNNYQSWDLGKNTYMFVNITIYQREREIYVNAVRETNVLEQSTRVSVPVVSLTKSYLSLILHYIADPTPESGVLVHCISGTYACIRACACVYASHACSGLDGCMCIHVYDMYMVRICTCVRMGSNSAVHLAHSYLSVG